MAPKAKVNPKPSPSSTPPAAQSVPLEDLFAALHHHAQNFEYEQAARVADQVLAIAPGDEDALRCKVVALIKSDAIDKALSTIQASRHLPIQLRFYERRKKRDKKRENPEIRHHYPSMIPIHRRPPSPDVANEEKTAPPSLLVTSNEEKIVFFSFEAIRRTRLRITWYARVIGQEMLMEEDYADDEIETELAPIAVQLAYVHQGQTEEAIEAYMSIINRNLSDASSLAVATNNLISLRGTKDVSDRNVWKELLIELSYDSLQAQEVISALPEMFPDSVTPVLLQAALLAREKKVAKAEEVLIQYADKFPDKSRPVLLARAQIAAAAGHFQISVESLSKIPEIQNMPATVATLVSLQQRIGDFGSAAAVLDSAIDWWKNAMTEENKLDLIMQKAAAFKLNHGREEEASQLYEKLVKSHGNIEALVGLVMTAAHTDLEKAELYEKQLKQLSGLKQLNVESLEKTPGARHVEGTHAVKVEVPEDVKKAKTKKRKRKPRYPKGFDPANPGPPPDPERWLPKRERSSYRPKRKDKRSQIRGSQGAVVREKHDSVAPATSTSVNGPSSKSGQNTSSSSKSGSQKATSSEHPKASSKSKKKSRS
ncbi:hypothetical protein BHE74_00013715 [Ensete ventricosum]|nr:hypothetical protein GW17_00004420 [Ensete ventricosum]RWW78076.1 hypothetical protein BHE74_00013715 [Ensete ventricosum]RZR92819.1 hypothetical protein BHM03_00021167 [Ensete ventricosum]